MSHQDSDNLLSEYIEIIDKRVRPRLTFYMERVNNKRRLAQWTRVLVLLLSLTIPIVVNLDRNLISNHPTTFAISVSLMSLLIAFISGLEGLHLWQHTRREYSKRNCPN